MSGFAPGTFEIPDRANVYRWIGELQDLPNYAIIQSIRAAILSLSATLTHLHQAIADEYSADPDLPVEPAPAVVRSIRSNARGPSRPVAVAAAAPPPTPSRPPLNISTNDPSVSLLFPAVSSLTFCVAVSQLCES